MNGKRLRIRARRKKLSEQNIEWMAGHFVGCKSGFEQGVIHAKIDADREHVLLLRTITGLESQLESAKKKVQEQSYAVLDAKRAAEAANKKALALEQQIVVPPAHSDWLHLPPFVLRANSAIDKDKLYTNLYGGTVTGRTPGRFPTMMTDAEGGILSPEISRRMIETIMGASPILGASRTVPMRSPRSFAEGGRVPGNPTFYWNADHAVEEPDAPIRVLENQADRMEEDFRQVNAEAVRAAFRYPFQPSSEMRTPEAEEGIRRASAGGVTDVEAGHSHSFDLVGGVTNNVMAAASAEDLQNLSQRMARLEATMGMEDPQEESPSEENVNATGGSDSQGGEHS